MNKRAHTRFVLAASLVYLRATDDDLYTGMNALTIPEQLLSLQQKTFKVSEPLTGSIMFRELNINYASSIIDNFQ